MDSSGTGSGNGSQMNGERAASSRKLLTLRREAESTALATTETRRDPAAASPGHGKQGGLVMVWPQLVSIELSFLGFPVTNRRIRLLLWGGSTARAMARYMIDSVNLFQAPRHVQWILWPLRLRTGISL